MNSFNTDEDTKRIVQKYATHNVDIITFNQSRHPRIKKESLLPVPRSPSSPIEQLYFIIFWFFFFYKKYKF
jgi:UTP--glucose-1-phosphate uridylyltransferase